MSKVKLDHKQMRELNEKLGLALSTRIHLFGDAWTIKPRALWVIARSLQEAKDWAASFDRGEGVLDRVKMFLANLHKASLLGFSTYCITEWPDFCQDPAAFIMLTNLMTKLGFECYYWSALGNHGVKFESKDDADFGASCTADTIQLAAAMAAAEILSQC